LKKDTEIKWPLCKEYEEITDHITSGCYILSKKKNTS